jgi:superfamily II DNA or RNA helicase
LCAALRDQNVEVDDAVRLRRAAAEAWTVPDLRPYQQAALDAWRLANYRGLVVLPTGSGKTRVAIAAMAQLELSSICLVPTRVLLEQWCAAIGAYYHGRVGCYGDGVKRFGAVTVSTYASAERHLEQLGDRFAVLIADEAHNAAAGPTADALMMSTATARLGLTATPPSNPDVMSRLAELLGPVVYELGVADLAGSYLASFDLITVMLDLDRREREAYEREAAIFRRVFRRFCIEFPDADWPSFMRFASRSAEGRRAVAAWRQTRRMLGYTAAKRETVGLLLRRHVGSKVLIFAPDNQAAYAIARDHLVMPITCDIGKPERRDALERFRRGELTGLVSARVLNEGVDVPDADVAIVVGGALGQREHVQRIGRVLRPTPGKRAVIYELVCRATAEVKRARRRRAGLAAAVTAQL